MKMNILVPTDFTERANNAIEYAVEMAKTTTTKITFLHVLPTDSSEDAHVLAKTKLDVIAQTVHSEYPDIHCSTEVVAGDVIASILSMAETLKPSLIIMETEGATSVTRWFIGSKTASVIEKTNCAVLSLPPNHLFSKPKRILYYTNFSRDDLKNAVDVVLIASLFNAEVIITHVTVEPLREEVESNLVEVFANEIINLTNYSKIKFIAQDDNTVPLGIDHIVSDIHADMVAISTRRRSVIEKIYNPSITKKLSLYSDIPVLAFHIND